MNNAPMPNTGTDIEAAELALSSTEDSGAEKDAAASTPNAPLFENPFAIEDLLVFDDTTVQRMLSVEGFGLNLDDLALSLHGAPVKVIRLIKRNLPPSQRARFIHALRCSASRERVKVARRKVLDGLFWELTYWKLPELYEELTEGEQIHPGIFQQLEPDLRGKIVLDVGAGSGRASFECVRHGARIVYAVEPSPGLLRILEKKLASQPIDNRIVVCQGRFDRIPLQDSCVDTALSCSAFTAEPEQGGEPGLAELKRVTKPGGKIVLIWPRREDYDWLTAHGFQYVALPVNQEMWVSFRSLQSALRCARLFYARNRAVLRYILKQRRPEVPFAVLGFNPPCDYCWLTVQ